MSKVLSACCVVVCMAAMGSSGLADTISITNGNFESVTAGKFTGWTYVPSTGGGPVANVVTGAAAIGGTGNSANMRYGTTNGGFLQQTVSSTGAASFALEFDFAVLETATVGFRSLSFAAFSTAGGTHTSADNIDSIKVVTTAANQQQIQVYKASQGWVDTGLFARTTADIGGDLKFDDGETPAVNHLKIVGTDYGLATQSVAITLTGGATNGTFTGSGYYVTTNAKVKDIAFVSGSANADYLVDNVSTIPEPGALLLLATGLTGLLAYAWRRRK